MLAEKLITLVSLTRDKRQPLDYLFWQGLGDMWTVDPQEVEKQGEWTCQGT